MTLSTYKAMRSLRDAVVIPYVLKAVPCIFLWIALQWDLWSGRQTV
ncbi:hypothetical protein [Rhodoflexus sp.]